MSPARAAAMSGPDVSHSASPGDSHATPRLPQLNNHSCSSCSTDVSPASVRHLHVALGRMRVDRTPPVPPQIERLHYFAIATYPLRHPCSGRLSPPMSWRGRPTST